MIIAAVGQKGGVGKSTLTINLGCELMRRGHRVLLVDTDNQGTLRTWADVAEELGNESPAVIVMGSAMWKPHELPHIAKSYDFVLIDTKGAAGKIQKAALMTCDLALLPLGSSALDLWGLTETLETLEEAQITRPVLEVRFIYSNWEARTRLARDIMAAVQGTDVEVLSPAVEHLVDFKDALAAGLGVTAYAPKGKAARIIRVLCNKIENMRAPALEVAS